MQAHETVCSHTRACHARAHACIMPQQCERNAQMRSMCCASRSGGNAASECCCALAERGVNVFIRLVCVGVNRECVHVCVRVCLRVCVCIHVRAFACDVRLNTRHARNLCKAAASYEQPAAWARLYQRMAAALFLRTPIPCS